MTARQRQILDFIGHYIALNGYPPSVREIGAAVGFRSANSASYQLGVLVERGLLERPGGGCRSRALRLVPGGAT
ncbi:MAG TPA: hypothetical protein VFT95_07130 [Micromonosporaceae bacterium]|nr:hypothetical protein [Micromonosporaceae bacterium]